MSPRKPRIRTGKAGFVLGAAMTAAVASATAWASWTELDTVVRGQGTVVPAGNIRRAQHQEGGTVIEILARDGDRVEAGQVLVRLSPAAFGAEVGEKTARVRSLEARLARFRARSAGESMPPAPAEADIAAWAAEAAASAADRGALEARVGVLRETKSKIRSQIASEKARLEGLRAQEAVLNAKVKLFRAGGASDGQRLDVEGQLAAVHAQAAGIPANIESLEAALREAEARVGEEQARHRAEGETEAAKTAADLAALRRSLEGGSDRLTRVEIKAPVRGIVQKLAVSAPGEVVPPAGTVAEIVPVGETLVVEAKLRPEDIRGVAVGMPAKVRLSAFDVSRYGHLEGKVVGLSAAAEEDKRTGRTYYVARVETNDTRIGGYEIAPGMTSDVSVVTGSRSVMGYLVAPLTTLASDALTER